MDILHTSEQMLDDQLDFIYNGSVQTQDDLPNAMDDRDEWRGRVR